VPALSPRFARMPGRETVQHSGRTVRRSDLAGISHSNPHPPERTSLGRRRRMMTISYLPRLPVSKSSLWSTSRAKKGLAVAGLAVLRLAGLRVETGHFGQRKIVPPGLSPAANHSARAQTDPPRDADRRLPATGRLVHAGSFVPAAHRAPVRVRLLASVQPVSPLARMARLPSAPSHLEVARKVAQKVELTGRVTTGLVNFALVPEARRPRNSREPSPAAQPEPVPAGSRARKSAGGIPLQARTKAVRSRRRPSSSA